jgi:hypothetical protein
LFYEQQMNEPGNRENMPFTLTRNAMEIAKDEDPRCRRF